VSVQTGAAGGGVGSHTVLGSHLTATVAPPLHTVLVWLWQSIPWPQSASVWHGAGWQLMDGEEGTSAGRQSAPGGHAGVGVTALAWQVRPWAQSLSLTQVCAAASPGSARTVSRAAIPRSGFASVMACSFDSCW
jgi:hypothetical protein